MALVPYRFLVRVTYPCRHVKDIPREESDSLLDLPEANRIDNFAAVEGLRNFADVRMAWNEQGLAFQIDVKGKEQAPRGDADRPRASDGVTLWIDTRDARTAHRASRYCHMFHFLPTGGGPDHDDPAVVQTKINRALEDAPLCQPSDVRFAMEHLKGGYRLEAFLPASALHGFDPEQNRRLGFFYVCRDAELGEQVLSVASEFPYWEDPSLWSVLELVR
jgi:hypothetical protein